MGMHETGMETESIGGSEEKDLKDGKRVKWQPPPLHYNLLSTNNKSISKSNSCRNENCTQKKGVAGIEGIEASEFKAYALDEEAHFFMKSTIGHSFEEISDAISTPRIYREDTMARADICPKIHRPRLQHTKGVAAKIREQYGYEISNTTYLYAEEAMYLIEIGKLQLHLSHAIVSVERARSLLLHSKTHPKSNSYKVKSCSVDEYLVYKHLLKQGYRLRRKDHNQELKLCSFEINPAVNVEENPPDQLFEKEMEMEKVDLNEDTIMDLDEPQSIIMETSDVTNAVGCSSVNESFSSPSSGTGNSFLSFVCTRGMKRKFGDFFDSQNTGDSTPTSSAKDNSEDEDADIEFDCIPTTTSDACMDSASETHPVHQLFGTYMVTEADSDTEIYDDDIPSTVHIEEIGYDYDGDIEENNGKKVSMEPQPSTSKACFSTEGLVDLAESDSDMEEDIKSFLKVWSKFIPNETIQIGFPPSILLPKGIPNRNTIYEFDMKNQESSQHDSDLEYYVDELNLNSSPGESDNELNSFTKHNQKICKSKSWKEWKQSTMEEASGVLNDSLLANDENKKACYNDSVNRLYLWNNSELLKENISESSKPLNIVYDLYHPSISSSVHKNRLKSDYQPSYVVAIVRHDEVIPSFTSGDITSHCVLVAVVSDETDIIFMKPDRSPIPSFF